MELNLVEILKNCPKGTSLFSSIHGEVELESVDAKDPIASINVIATHDNGQRLTTHFTRDGRYFIDYGRGECVLFPARDCRDWSQFKQPQPQFKKGDRIMFRNIYGYQFFGIFDKYKDSEIAKVYAIGIERKNDFEVDIAGLTKVEKFDPKWLKTGDPVLVRDNCDGEWLFSTFSHIPYRETGYCFVASCKLWLRCVPYNCETKHLVGETDPAPEFYNIK